MQRWCDCGKDGRLAVSASMALGAVDGVAESMSPELPMQFVFQPESGRCARNI